MQSYAWLENLCYYVPTSLGREHYEMMGGVCLSVACLDLTREHKGLGSPKLEAYHTRNPWTYLEVKMSKVKVTRQINAVTDNANTPCEAKRSPIWQLFYLMLRWRFGTPVLAGRGRYSFLKISLLNLKDKLRLLKQLFLYFKADTSTLINACAYNSKKRKTVGIERKIVENRAKIHGFIQIHQKSIQIHNPAYFLFT